MRSELIPAVRGMRDILPAQVGAWQRLEKTAAECFRLYGYGEIRTPIVERLELFNRQLGENTDLVQKEMYSFTDALNGDEVALRPEATVSAVRALLAADGGRGGGVRRVTRITRVWYGGPMFRHERPQKGRYRQFHQFGAEALGGADAAIDAEQILMLARLWRLLGIADKLSLDINNLGDAEERARHRQKLREYFLRYENDLDDDARRQLLTNPLRLLDNKNPKVTEIAAAAPRMRDELGEQSRRFAESLKEKLNAAGVCFSERDSLVRGLDYYNLTVFEWSLANDERRQNTICGGGRYDGLAEKIGGAAAPGCGFALGVERVLELLEEEATAPSDCYLAITAPQCANFADKLAELCRDGGLSVWRHVGGGNVGRQLKKADTMRIPLALIVGDEEQDGNYVTLKHLDSGRQSRAPLSDAAAEAKRMLSHE